MAPVADPDRHILPITMTMWITPGEHPGLALLEVQNVQVRSALSTTNDGYEVSSIKFLERRVYASNAEAALLRQSLLAWKDMVACVGVGQEHRVDELCMRADGTRVEYMIGDVGVALHRGNVRAVQDDILLGIAIFLLHYLLEAFHGLMSCSSNAFRCGSIASRRMRLADSFLPVFSS